MASTTAPTNKTSLPCKKRKASNASSTVSDGSDVGASSRGRGASAEGDSLGEREGPSAITSTKVASVSMRTRANSTSNNMICESRLPRKKRKDSSDERIRKLSFVDGSFVDGSDQVVESSVRTRLEDSVDEGRIRRESSADVGSALLTEEDSTTMKSASVTSEKSRLPPFENLQSHKNLALSSDPLLSIDASGTATTDIGATDVNNAQGSALTSLNPLHSTSASSALEHLDALVHENAENDNDGAKPAAVAPQHPLISVGVQPSELSNTAGGGLDDEGSMTSSGNGLLLEAMGLGQHGSLTEATKRDGTAVSGNGRRYSHSSQTTVPPHSDAYVPLSLHPPHRERLDSGATTQQSHDRWETFASMVASAPRERDRADSGGTRGETASHIGSGGVLGRERCDSWMGRRDRLESWGGMSDLSVPVVIAGSTHASAPGGGASLDSLVDHHANALQQYHHTSQGGGAGPNQASSIPSRISLQRDRLNSIASLGDLSLSAFAGNAANVYPMVVEGTEVAGDIHAFVAAAMATVGDQLMELADEMEEVAGETMNFEDFKREMGLDSECGDSSVASPMIGAVSDSGAPSGRPRTWSTSSGLISVDLDAVQAAVDAAEAASGSLGLAPHPGALPSSSSTESKRRRPNSSSEAATLVSKHSRSRSVRRQLPLHRDSPDDVTSTSKRRSDEPKRASGSRDQSKSSLGGGKSNSELQHTKKGPSTQTKNLPPLKKRSRRASPDTPATVTSASVMPTPKVSNRTIHDESDDSLVLPPPDVVSSSVVLEDKKSKQSGQANQKWESMYSCLLDFALERQLEETKGMTEEEKKVWIWDGNVPTNYKTKDGKALGRWVNNQRSAKSKGILKDDREERLIEAGLKWSVMSSNCWNEMLEELTIYIKEQHKLGKAWDGNVPTNYQIKTRPNGGFNGEDKNLGRWINRQRSMFQAGRLRKDRQLTLESMGLKWSMLATTSWDDMYDTLKEYVDQIRKSGEKTWDGNVPANYKTTDNPPRALGRWVNRQRSAFAKKKLKKECVIKLNELGLKWSVHNRYSGPDDFDDGDDDMEEEPCDTPSGRSDSSGKENTTKALPETAEV